MTLLFQEVGDQMVHMEVERPGSVFQISAVYAKCTRVGRCQLWEAIKAVAARSHGPWLVAGNFNIISNATERSGGAPPNPRNMVEFNKAVFNCGLSDMGFEGSQFIWTNGVVWQHLDRALSNGAWTKLLGCSKVMHLMRGRSDHAPLVIRCGEVNASASSF